MIRAKHLLVALISALAALVPLGVIIWLTSGTSSPVGVHWASLVLVAPLAVTEKLGLGRAAGLGLCFLTFWAVTFAILASFAKSAALEERG